MTAPPPIRRLRRRRVLADLLTLALLLPALAVASGLAMAAILGGH